LVFGEECEGVFIFIYFVARDFSIDDFGEDGHGKRLKD